MTFTRLWNSITSALSLPKTASARRKRRVRNRLARRSFISFESLEDRRVLALVTWDGGGGTDLSWNNELNWSGNVRPGIADDVSIDFGANDFTVVHSSGNTSVKSLTNRASLNVSGGTLLLGEDSTIDGSLTLSSATLGGAGDIEVAGPFTWNIFPWSTGTLQGINGQGSLTANGGTTITGTAFVQEGFRYINPVGKAVTWTSGSIQLRTAGAFINNGFMDIQGNNLVDTNVLNSYFENNGTLVKSGGNAVTYFYTPVHNNGTIDVQVGGLHLGYAGFDVTNNGSILGASDTAIALIGTVTSPGDIDGDVVRFSGGVMSGSFSANETHIGGGTFTGSVLKFGSLTGSADLTDATLAPGVTNLSSLTITGTLSIDEPITVSGAMTLNGGKLITGSPVVVAGLLTWNNFPWDVGTLQGVNGQGSLTANGGTTITGTAFVQDGFRFVNPVGRSIDWAAGSIQLRTGGAFINDGFMDIQGDNLMDTNVLTSYFENNGRLVKSAGTARSLFQTSVRNYGTIEVQVGGISLGYNASFEVINTGTIHGVPQTAIYLPATVTSSGSIEGDIVSFGEGLMSGSFRANQTTIGDAIFTGSVSNFGSLTVGSADLTDAALAPGVMNLSSLDIFGTLRVDEPITVSGAMSLDGGKLITGSPVSVTGPFTWNFGTLQGVGGQGTLTANGGTKISGVPFVQNGFRFVNPIGQAVSWLSGSIQLRTGGAFINNGFMDIPGDYFVDTNALDSFFENNGTLMKSGGTGTSAFQTPVRNNGMIDVKIGTLSLGYNADFEVINTGTIRGGAATAILFPAAVTSSGIIEGNVVDFGAGLMSGSFSANQTTIGSWGNATFTGDVLKFGSLTVGNADLSEATLESGVSNLSSLNLYGTLITDEDLTVTGPFIWNSGVLQGVAGQGSLTVISDTSLDGTAVNRDIRNFTLINHANMTWTGGTVRFFGTTGGFVNSTGATFTNSFDGMFGSVDGSCLQFVNHGLFVKSGHTGTTNLQMQLYNRGTVEIQQGQLYLGCGYVSNDPGNPPAPGISYPPDHPPEYQNDSPVVIDPGSDPVIVPGSYTQTVNGLLIEQIAGHSGVGPFGTPGTDYGQLVVMGDVALNGTLEVQVLGGFIPTIGQQYLVIDNRGTNPILGTFVDLPEGSIVLAGNYGFKVTYRGGENDNDFVLTMDRYLNTPPSAPVDDDPAPNAILENSLSGTVGITAFAPDPDIADTMTYSLTDDAGGRFAIDPVTGVVAVANGASLDYEATTSHTITVEANDGQGGTSTESFTIDVLNATATISGTVFLDVDGDGTFDGGTESAIDAVMIELYDSSGGLLDTDWTELGGVYAFTVSDEKGTYNVRETQPIGVNNGAAILGSAGGTVISPDEMRLVLTGSSASDYDFTESGQAVQSGDAASIGFWQNKNGQALIRQGGATLVSWLNANFGNIFGNTFGDGSGGDNASEVASFYKSEFFSQKLKGTPKVDAQFMATALATFFTSSNLSGGIAAASYGFNVTQTGLGTKVVNIGGSGAAFGVPNSTNMTIMSLLLATNRLTGAHASGYSTVYDANGDSVLDDNEKALRVLANTIYSAINEGGHF